MKRMVCINLQIDKILRLGCIVSDEVGGWVELEFDLPHSGSDLRISHAQHYRPERGGCRDRGEQHLATDQEVTSMSL